MNQITIQTPTPSLHKSVEFYEKLGFQKLLNLDRPIYTDGKAIIEIIQDPFARLGLRFYKNSWEEEIGVLMPNHTIIDYGEGHLTMDPNGVWIYMIASGFPINSQDEKRGSKLGKFAGISIETTSKARSMAFYKILGLDINDGSPDSQWVTLSDSNGFTISFMNPLSCPHLFFNPSLTYFNGSDNPAVIQTIRNEGIPITEEITCFNTDGDVDNIIIRDPGGLGFFIFND